MLPRALHSITHQGKHAFSGKKTKKMTGADIRYPTVQQNVIYDVVIDYCAAEEFGVACLPVPAAVFDIKTNVPFCK